VKLGTLNFQSKRLTQAREALGLSQVNVSRLLDVTHQTINQYENGEITPAPEVFERMCAVLAQPATFFINPLSNLPIGTIHYRKLKGTTITAMRKAEMHHLWLREIVSFVEKHIELPDVNFPNYGITPSDPTLITELEIEEIATAVRRHWNLNDGPAPHLVRLLEAHGSIVTRLSLSEDSLDALSEWAMPENRPIVVLNADKSSLARSRFDLGHELGHMLLHRNVSRQSLENRTTFDLVEKQANLFSSAFLLPSKSFLSDLFSVSLDAFRVLKPKWKVSIAAMIMKAQSLELLNDNEASRMWANYRRRKWLGCEPYDNEWAVEQPSLLPQAFAMMVEHNVATKEEIESTVRLNRKDISKIANLTPNFFEPDGLKLNILKMSQTTD
jgi:Zn-dependent peptidase ImmA (M78 family)/transcriptional regulator with XRE-family HTH domain